MNKIKKHYNFKSNNQVWRILITNSDKLIIETRNTETKQVYFNCFDALTGKTIFSDFQLEEKFWIGIETTYDNIIYFHKYAKPDMPGHKEIIAFDIDSQKVIWTTDEYSFLFIYNELVYTFQQKFEGQKFFALDYKTGALVEDIGNDTEKIDDLSELSEIENHYDDYLFPLKFVSDVIEEENISNIISEYSKDKNVVGDIEYNIYESNLIFNFHEKLESGYLKNQLIVYCTERNKEIENVVLNSYANAFVPDSFFTYKNLLFLLKGKNEVSVLKII